MNSPSVIRQTVTVTRENGLHLVPCSEIVKYVRDYPGDVRIYRDNLVADPRSVLDLLQLKAEKGTELIVEATGADAAALVQGLASLLAADLDS
jgi:phosphocarrier protein HPr